ncbi:MAG: glycosyltransferase, partial [Fidelibacterota bacterium]
ENFDHPVVDFKFYLPLDFPWVMKQLLRTLKPQKVIFTSYDIWPNLIWSCRRAGIPTTLFAARIVPNSTKQWPVLSNFYQHIYGAIRQIYTVSEADHHRLETLLGRRTGTEVRNLGNPRYDRVKERTLQRGMARKDRNSSVVVLGSLHKEDDEVVIPPLLDILRRNSTLRILWAPHEPEPEVIEEISRRLSEAGIHWELYGRRLGRFRDCQVLIVDGVGYLAELYGRGILAYVGGGFSTGVHNVMEAAIAGIPVLFGPRYRRSHEAEQLLEYGGGVCIATAAEFHEQMARFLEDQDLRHRTGQAALEVIEANLGATARILQAILGS